MKKIAPIALIVLLWSLVTSCHPVTGLELTNNTGADVTIVSIDIEQKETTYAVRDGLTTGVKVGARIYIKHEKGIWNYHFPPPPQREFLKHVKMNIYLERVQIEPGGTLYLIDPGAPHGPTTKLPLQPPGYPINPI